MRRPHRNIEIFSMSVLDMFASALGAFIVCVVILFPHYKRDLKAEMARAEAKLEKARETLTQEQARLRNAEAEVARQRTETEQARIRQANLERCREALSVCRVKLARNFLLIQVEWDDMVDLNLSVRDPRGNEFSWRKTNRSGRDFPDSKAQLSVDIAEGPGLEVWVDPDALQGRYTVEYSIPRPFKQGIGIRTTIFDRLGRKRIASATLPAGATELAGPSIRFDETGVMSVR
jgi:hypothetical protein